MVFDPNKQMVGYVRLFFYNQRPLQKLLSKFFCGALTTSVKEPVWETESNFVLTPTSRHKTEDPPATAGHQDDFVSIQTIINIKLLWISDVVLKCLETLMKNLSNKTEHVIFTYSITLYKAN